MLKYTAPKNPLYGQSGTKTYTPINQQQNKKEKEKERNKKNGEKSNKKRPHPQI